MSTKSSQVSTNTMKTKTQSPAELLTELQDIQFELENAFMEAQNQNQRTGKALDDVRVIVRGYERSTRPAEMELCAEAQDRLAQLQQQSIDEQAHVAQLKSEIDATKARIAVLFEGQSGYEVAVSLYREAKAQVAEIEAALTACRAQQQTAADALDKAKQASATATRNIETALDAEAITRARAALNEAKQAEGDAMTLTGNLDRHARALNSSCEEAKKVREKAKQRAFQCKASVLAATLKQKLAGVGADAFAAALLAGPPMHFKSWLAQVIEHDPSVTKAHQAALVAELEVATHA